MKNIILSMGLTALCAAQAWAVPQTLNFQGRLSESGAAVNGMRDMTFRIFAAPSEGAALFTEAHTGAAAVLVSTGIFNAVIGSLTEGGIPLAVFDGADKYVEVEIAGNVLPRQKMSSVGYSLRSAVADALAPGAPFVVTTMSVTSLTTQDARVNGTLKVGTGTITMGSLSHPTGPANTIGFTDGAAYIQTMDPAAGPLTIQTGGSQNLLLNPGGNVGIGTLTPSSKLDVAGPIEYQAKNWGRGSRITVMSDTDDAAKDAACAALGPYVAATLGDGQSHFGRGDFYGTFSLTFVGDPYSWTGCGEEGCMQTALQYAPSLVACVHQLAPLRFTRTALDTSSADAIKDAFCAAQFGESFESATFIDVTRWAHRYIWDSNGSSGYYSFTFSGLGSSQGACYIQEGGSALICDGPSPAPLACIHK